MAQVEINGLLDALSPQPEDVQSLGGIWIEGFVLRGREELVRIVAGDIALEFAADDIIEIIDLEPTEGQDFALGVPVRLNLRQGARLLGALPAAVYFPLLERQIEPFAYAVRKTPPPMQEAPRFSNLQSDYRKKHGLE